MPPAKPNILLIITDQQHADALGVVDAGLRTPGMDAIASGGARFTNANCTWPLCTPSRASLFTGLMPQALGIGGNVKGLPEARRDRELGWLLRHAGYRCGYAGKWHLPKQTMEDGHGFEVLCGMDDELTTQVACNFLGRDDEAPFCLVTSFFQPHGCCPLHRFRDPRQVKQIGLGHYAPSSLPDRQYSYDWPADVAEPAFLARCPDLPANFAPVAHEPAAVTALREKSKGPAVRPEFWQEGEEWNAARTWSPEAFRHYRWGYQRLVEWVDEQVAAVLAALEASGKGEDTLVIFTSDHGDLLGAHRLVSKNLLYRDCVRIPLLMRWPGHIAPGTVSDHLVSNGLDILPTCCAAAGISVPQDCTGHSLLGLASGTEQAELREDLVVACSSGRLLLSQDHAYMRYTAQGVEEEFYDLRRDPLQTTNLIRDSRYAADLAACRTRLLAWQAANGDQGATQSMTAAQGA